MNFALTEDLRARLLRLQGWFYDGSSLGTAITGDQFLGRLITNSFLIQEDLVVYAVYNAKNQIICDPFAPGRQSTGRLVVTNYRVIFFPDFTSNALTIPLVNIKEPQLKKKMFKYELIQIEFFSPSVSNVSVRANPGSFSDDLDKFNEDTKSEFLYETSKIDFLALKKRTPYGGTFFENLKYACEQGLFANGGNSLLKHKSP